MDEEFCIAAFRSRQQVMAFEKELRRHGVASQVIITPRAVAMGCGLSVRFELADARRAQQVYKTYDPGNFIGFYRVRRDAAGRTDVRVMGTA